jgi:hypothetical protein
MECHKADGVSGTEVKIANVPMLSLFGHPAHGKILQRNSVLRQS